MDASAIWQLAQVQVLLFAAVAAYQFVKKRRKDNDDWRLTYHCLQEWSVRQQLALDRLVLNVSTKFFFVSAAKRTHVLTITMGLEQKKVQEIQRQQRETTRITVGFRATLHALPISVYLPYSVRTAEQHHDQHQHNRHNERHYEWMNESTVLRVRG